MSPSQHDLGDVVFRFQKPLDIIQVYVDETKIRVRRNTEFDGARQLIKKTTCTITGGGGFAAALELKTAL